VARRNLAGLLALVLAASLLTACRDENGKLTVRVPGTKTTPTGAPSPVRGEVVVVAGDLVCSAEQETAAAGSRAQCQSEATAALAKSVSPDAVLFPGDIQYDRGTKAEYAQVWAKSSWARFKSITYAAVGNHEYSTTDAAPYFATFGARAGPRDRGYYSADIGTWHVIALNSNCQPAGGCVPGSPQERWLRADLAAAAAAGRECTLAFWHHPRWSSGYHGSDESMEPLWAALADRDAELVVAGHDHHYERFAPKRGVRQFIAGTGGRSLYPTLGVERGSEIRESSTFGVLELRLGDGEYGWKFHGIGDATFTDSGREACH